MKKVLIIAICLLGITLSTYAEDMKLTVPELEPKLNYGEVASSRPILTLNVSNTDENCQSGMET